MERLKYIFLIVLVFAKLSIFYFIPLLDWWYNVKQSFKRTKRRLFITNSHR
jgi:hypothetical protein